MTLRKQLSIIMLFVIAISIVINSLISSSYIDKYFRNYVSDQYDQNVDAIKTFSRNLLVDGVQNKSRAETELKNFIDDPIVGISIYDAQGNRIAYAEDSMFSMHGRGHMGGMMSDVFDTEEDLISIDMGRGKTGQLVISRSGDVQSSETVRLFKRAMIFGTLISGLVVLGFALLIVAISSKKLTKDLRETARYARSIEKGETLKIESSKVLEVRGLQVSLQNLSTRLKLQKSARKQKTDQLAHESRTPLTILKTHCEGALDGVVEMDQNRLENCINQIENLSNLIENMNDFIEYEGETEALSLKEYDLVSEIRKIIKGLSVQYKRKGLDLIYEGPKSFMVYKDSALLNQALYNLLTNAYKFTNTGGVKVILSEQGDQDWSIKVVDTGRGIDKADFENIFKAYYRVDNTNDNNKDNQDETEGDGLGLHITKNNTEKMGGRIDVSSTLGKGSTFTIHFTRTNISQT